MKKTKIDIAAQILPKPMDLNVGLPEIGYTPFEEGDTGTVPSGTEGDEDAVEDMTGTSDDGGEGTICFFFHQFLILLITKIRT